MPYRPIYLWEITVNKLFTAVGTPAHSRPTVAGPTGQQGPSGRSPAVGTYEGWVTSYGVCGHLLDSLSAWGHSATPLKPEQAHFGRFYGIMFFRQDSLKSEGRCHADPRIKTRPGADAPRATVAHFSSTSTIERQGLLHGAYSYCARPAQESSLAALPPSALRRFLCR